MLNEKYQVAKGYIVYVNFNSYKNNIKLYEDHNSKEDEHKTTL